MTRLPQPGDALPQWSVESVPLEKMKILAAILRDPNPVHWDREAVAAKGYGNKVINQGPINLCYVTNMLEAWAGVGSLRRLVARFTANVVEGDRVTAGGTVTVVRNKDGRTFVDCDVWLERHGVGRAVEGSATVEFEH
jgi:acyl dehydratase